LNPNEPPPRITRASAHRDDYHGFRTADYDRKYKAICESEKKAKPVNTCKGCPLIDVCPAVQMENQPERKREYKKPEAHDVPKEVEAMAAFFADMFPGSEIQIQRVDLKRTPGTNAGQRTNERTGSNGTLESWHNGGNITGYRFGYSKRYGS